MTTIDTSLITDEKAIKVLIESIGYQVGMIEPFSCLRTSHIYMTSNTRCRDKNFGKVKRKIEQKLPIIVYSCGYNNRLNAPFISVEIDRSRSIDGINDLLSTFEVLHETTA